mmetsp:Transcript_14744/g.33247  ORF Transcript_14744/g.33247 Transcript_14744/m.33247 type:complete len:200 (-) Transcript_14744:483-1082(-)
MQDVLPRLAFLLREHLHLLEECYVLVGGELRDGLNTRVNAPDTTVGELLLHRLVVVVSVEDDLPVVIEGITGDLVDVLTGISFVTELGELLGYNRVKNSVHHGHVLGRSDGAELEPSASVGEWRGTVAILCGHLEGANLLRSKIKHLRARDVLSISLAVLKVLQVERHVFSEVCRDDGRGGLARTETEVVSGARNGHPH